MNPRRLPAFAAFYRAQFPTTRQQHRGFERNGITLLQASQVPHSSLIAGTGEWRLSQSLSGSSPVRRQVAGRWQEGCKPIGSFSITPAELEMPVEILAPYRVRVLAIEARRLESLLSSIGASGTTPLEKLVDRLVLRDAAIERLIGEFWNEAAASDAVARLLADGMTGTLAARLLRLAGYRAVEPDPRALAPRRLRRALDLIDSRLAEDLSIGEIAEAAGLSAYHFARAFRAATGLPPYRYVTQQRIARAQRLIEDTDLSLAQIAFECGFGSQAQFTSTFTRLVGVSPGRWRAERKG